MSLWDRITGRTQTPEIEPDAPPASVMGASSPFSFLDLPSSVPIEFAYPSRDGYPVASPEEVIRAHYAHVDAAFRAFDQRSLLQGFDEDFAQLIHQFASFVSLLPASRQYHHHKPGGLFAHSLDVATKALHYSSGHIMNSDSDPRDREADEFAWSVSAFVAGLLHDIGKVETMGSIVARTMRSETPSFSSSSAPNRKYTWRPEVSPLTSWLAQYNIDTVYLNFTDEGDNRHIHLIHPYFFRIVPPSLRSLIFNANPSISKLFRKYLENPAATSTNTLCRLVSDADTQSVRFDRDPQGLPGAIDVNTLIIRRFLEFAAKEKYWNTPGSAFQHGLVEHINNGTRYYFELDFFICDEKNVAAFVRYLMDEDLFGNRLPTNIEEGVFEALLSHGVVTSTIPSILPVRLSDPRLPHYYPASLAKVRFSAKLEGGRGGVPTVHPIGHEPIVLDLPVLAISKSPVAGHRDHMPTLSFDGEPGTPTWPRPIRIEDGKLLPADDALDDDPVARQEIIEATGLDPDSDDPDEATTAAMMTRLRARRRALRKGATMLDGKEFGGRAAPSEDASPPSRPALSDEVPDQSATNEGHEAALVTGT
ncbi:MAG: TraI domain-containing protein, partial [Pseudomonadota bacterium]